MTSSSLIPSFSETDIVAAELVPRDWIDNILRVVEVHAEPAVLVGGTSTSLEPAGSNVNYRLLDGEQIRDHLRWLDDLYRGPLLAIASRAAERVMEPSASLQAGVNINILDGPGGRYELHLDSNPLTGLLFVTAHDESTGGQLIFRVGEEDVFVDPRPGVFITFDARTLPHAVTPLTRTSIRISAPMNYYGNDERSRPSDLDGYLYGQHDTGR